MLSVKEEKAIKVTGVDQARRMATPTANFQGGPDDPNAENAGNHNCMMNVCVHV